MNKDTIQLNGFNQFRMPKLKGHVKITLHNPTTGKNEVVEGENIVTNAVRDIMSANYLGGVDYSKMFPLWQKWYGGILCYENAHPTVEGDISPDDYFAYTQSQNPLTAHAGGTIIDSAHDEDMKRGNPAALSRVFTENSVKQVWEWSPSHGNGKITSLSLTHADTGDAGLGSDTYAFSNFSPVENLSLLSPKATGASDPSNVVAMYDDSHGVMYYLGDSESISESSSDKITVQVKKLAYLQAGLLQTQSASTSLERVFTVDTSVSFASQPAYFFDYDTKYLWLFGNLTGKGEYGNTWNTSAVQYTIIDCENEEEVTSGTITSDTANLSCVNPAQYIAGRQRYTNIIKDGNYVYLPTTSDTTGRVAFSNVTGFKKINITSQAEQESITFNQAMADRMAIMKSGDFLIMSGRVVNSGVGYSCFNYSPVEPNQVYSFGISTPFKVSSYHMGLGPASFNYNRSIFASKLINTTKFNLQSSVQKSASQSMIIEYTLEEVEEEEES